MTIGQFAILVIGCGLSFGAGIFLKQQAVNTANEAKLEAQNAFQSAKTEYQKLKAGAKHRLDQIFGS